MPPPNFAISAGAVTGSVRRQLLSSGTGRNSLKPSADDWDDDWFVVAVFCMLAQPVATMSKLSSKDEPVFMW
jgi:hypothetical protein